MAALLALDPARRALPALRAMGRQHTANGTFHAAGRARAPIRGTVVARCTPLPPKPEITRLLPRPVQKQWRRGTAQLHRACRPLRVAWPKATGRAEGTADGTQALVKLVRIMLRQVRGPLEARAAPQLSRRALQKTLRCPLQGTACRRAVLAPICLPTLGLVLTNWARDARAHPALRLVSTRGAQRRNAAATRGAGRAKRRARVRGSARAPRCIASVADDALRLG